MPTRGLVDGEKALLKTVFGDTLPYDTQQITTNDSNVGGADNSITYSGTPHFATALWCYDFSVDGEPHWVFVHEFGHVWQSIYGTPPILGALANYVKNGGDYGKSYPYDLTASTDFMDYNIEQQASICADYWAVLNNTDTRQCTNPSNPKDSDYAGLIAQVQNPKGASAGASASAAPSEAQPTATASNDPPSDGSAPADPEPTAADPAPADSQSAS
jgi:hypothetical protein